MRGVCRRKESVIMGIDSRIYLPPTVRIDDVADVIGALAGLTPEKSFFGSSEGWATHVPGVRAKATHTASMATIYVDAGNEGTLIDGDRRHYVCYFFESLDQDYKPCRYLLPRSTAFWIAIGRGLIRFFGGSLSYSDVDDTINETLPAKPTSFVHAEGGEAWYALQQAKLDVKPITLEELAHCATIAAY